MTSGLGGSVAPPPSMTSSQGSHEMGLVRGGQSRPGWRQSVTSAVPASAKLCQADAPRDITKRHGCLRDIRVVQFIFF